jgi:hypothetical protein
MRTGEVIAKLAEDAYFMRVDNRVAQVPPVGIANPTTKPQVAVQLTTVATVLEESYRLTPTVLGHQPVDLPKVATASAVPAVTAISSLIAILAAEAAAAGAPHTELEGEPVAGAIAAAEVTQIATSPVSRAVATMPVAESRKFGATNLQARTTAFPPSRHGFAIYFSRRNSNHWESPSTMRSKIQYSGLDATPSPSKTLVAIMTQSASTFLSAWIKLHLHGSSHSRSTRSTSGTSSRTSSPATSVTPQFLINVISANDRFNRVKPTDNGQT